MDTSAPIPAEPAPEMTRPRTTCHMVWPMALIPVSTTIYIVHFLHYSFETYTTVLQASSS
jgi:hypothetical protein